MKDFKDRYKVSPMKGSGNLYLMTLVLTNKEIQSYLQHKHLESTLESKDDIKSKKLKLLIGHQLLIIFPSFI